MFETTQLGLRQPTEMGLVPRIEKILQVDFESQDADKNFKSEDKSCEFVSDNCTSVCPEVIDELVRANIGCEPSYGSDSYKQIAVNLFEEIFSQRCDVFFVSSGVAANGISLASIVKPYEAVIASRVAHIGKDERGAISFFGGGSGIISRGCQEDKVDEQAIYRQVHNRNDVHYQRPSALSLTQATEKGRLYSFDELESVVGIAKKCGLFIHVDGARLANAAVSMGVRLLERLGKIGVDIVTFGGSKNGGMNAEAIVVLNSLITPNIMSRMKQSGHLLSKGRYLSASWIGLLREDVWLRNAANANKMARRLATKLKQIDGIELACDTEANSVLITCSSNIYSDLCNTLPYLSYKFISPGSLRFTCAWNTTQHAVDSLASMVRTVVGEHDSTVSERGELR